MNTSKSKSRSNGADGCCNAFDLENICTSPGPRGDEDSVAEDYDYVRAHKSDGQWMSEARAKVQAMLRTNYLTAIGIPLGISAMGNNSNNNSSEDVESNMPTSDKEREFDDFQKETAAYDTDESSTIQANILMISGCEDRQTSADVVNASSFSLPNPNGRSGGACTSALLKVLYSNDADRLTFVQVLGRMRKVLSRGAYSQIPQLTSSQPIDLNQDFYLVPPNCTGTRRAVLIGINYEGQDGELSGCHNDCLNMKDYIMNEWGFEEENIIVLMDDRQHTSPTRYNILQAYKTLAASCQSGDAVFCHYSGHGGRVVDDDVGEEVDGYDETLVPVDYYNSGQIRDDDLNETLLRPMPDGVSAVFLMDCCHSGTVLDLPYQYGVTYGNGAKAPLPKSIMFCCCLLVWLVIAAAVVLPLYLTQGWGQ